VVEVDEDGDALVNFEAHDVSQWVIGSNFCHLEVLGRRGPESDTDDNRQGATDAAGAAAKRRGSVILVGAEASQGSAQPESEAKVAGRNLEKLAAASGAPVATDGHGLPDIPEVSTEVDADSSDAEREHRRDAKLRVGQVVLVREEFSSDSAEARKLCPLDKGTVQEVDAQGDALIRFEGEAGLQWVSRQKLDRLVALKSAPPQRSPESEDEAMVRGTRLLFKSVTHNRWIECVVDEVRQDGAIQVDVKPNLWLHPDEQQVRIRRKGKPIFSRGDYVQYMSATFGTWVDGEVVDVREQDGAVSLDLKQGHWFSTEEQQTKIRYPPVSTGALVGVLRDIMSDSSEPVAVKRGTRGIVRQVDGDGDALIEFDGHVKNEWLFKSKLDDLRVMRRDGEDVGSELKVGDTVQAARQFMTDSKHQVVVKEGERGRVVEIDTDGDLLIQFVGLQAKQWVAKGHSDRLRVVKGA